MGEPRPIHAEYINQNRLDETVSESYGETPRDMLGR